MTSREALLVGNSHFFIWLAWLLYWKVSAAGVKAKTWDESPAQRLTHYGPLIMAALLFNFSDRIPYLRDTIFHRSSTTVLIGTTVLVAGLLFTVWARVVLAGNGAQPWP